MESSKENLINQTSTTSFGSDSKTSNGLSNKTLSPTLIGQAFKVMKNLFSPDKIMSK